MDLHPFKHQIFVCGRLISETSSCSPNWTVRFTVWGWRALWSLVRNGYVCVVQVTGPDKYDADELIQAALARMADGHGGEPDPYDLRD